MTRLDTTDAFGMTIDAQRVFGENWIDVVDPSDGQVFARAPDCSPEQLDRAVASAQHAFPAWRATPLAERQAMVANAGAKLVAEADAMAALFTREHGRPLEAAREEIVAAGEWMTKVATLKPPTHVIEDTSGQRIEVTYAPLGVVCAIAPWNFPVELAMWKVAPALVAGNAIVLKPSPYTPLCTLRIGELFQDFFPPGVLNVVSGGDALGPRMTAHPGFSKITFTGSTATGRKVMETAARDLKRLTLELGGNDAAIVMPDVDIDAVAESIFFGAFFNTAQVCIATKRLYVHEAIHGELLKRLHALAQSTRIGPGAEPGVKLGPLQNKRQFDRVRTLIDEARRDGLRLLEGAAVPDQGFFVPIILVDDPPEASAVVQEEAFGPILPVLKFHDVDDVVTRVNASPFGLAAAIWCADPVRSRDIASRLDVGTVWVNHNLVLRHDVPFAGHKQSGLGVENGIEGLLAYMTPRAIYTVR